MLSSSAEGAVRQVTPTGCRTADCHVQAHPPRLKGSQEHALRDELDVVKVNRPAEVAERKPVWRNKTGAD